MSTISRNDEQYNCFLYLNFWTGEILIKKVILFLQFLPNVSKKTCSFRSKASTSIYFTLFKGPLYIGVCVIIITVLESQTTLGHSSRVMHKNQTLNWDWEKTGWFTPAGDVIRPQHARFQRPHSNIENDSASYCCCFAKTGFGLLAFAERF